MLRQEQNAGEKAVSAAYVRVTPEELAAAITRLEAHKDSTQRRLESTVAIGEVVQQLGLDATPEEVLAEVHAGRTLPSKRLSAKERLNLYVAAGALVIAFAIFPISRYFAGHPSYDVTTVSTASLVPVSGSQPSHIFLDPNLLVGEVSGKVVMLSEVGDNQPVHCTFDGSALAFGSYSPNIVPNSWTLIKHGGQVYVRGRVQAMSAKVLSRDGAEVLSASPNVSADGLATPITMPLKDFDAVPNTDITNTYMFHAQNIHLDKHAWEKW